MKEAQAHRIRRTMLLISTTAGLFPVIANAQAAEDAAAAEPVETIVVTGSRIVANGYEAPTPVTVVSSQELLDQTPESLAAGLADLPQFKQTSGSNVVSSQARNTNSGNYLNLRGLGEIETLLLLDGQRLPPTSYVGTTDANIIPQALIERVDVVTGGASAAYGSDAVAGVVNFVLDKNFEGIKGVGQAGISSRGDDYQIKTGLAFGKSFGRLHFEGSFDYFYQPGIPNNGERPYGGNYEGGWVNVGANPDRPCTAGTCAENPFTPMYNVRLARATYGTLVNSGRNAEQAASTNGESDFSLVGYTFDPDGGYHLADLGQETGTSNFNVGGADTSVSFGTTLTSKLRTRQAFGRLDYDFENGMNAFLQGSFTKANTEFVTVGAGTQFNSFQIFSDNAFLPEGFRETMEAEGIASFVGSRVEADQTPKRAYNNNEATTILGGFNGMIGDFDWSLTGSWGNSDLKVRHAGNFNQRKWFAALDAVRGPQGNIVCRITLTNPGLQDDCLPWNLFGEGSPSDGSYAYFEEESTFHVKSRQTDFAANISGPIFDLPAGAVMLALGGEFRHQYLDMASNNDPSTPIDITGLRTYAKTYNLKYNSTNQGKAHGTQDIKEIYGEIAVPVFSDKPMFQTLDLNGAVRYTDYSVTGGIWAWKVGATWEPNSEFRLRGTYSQDIRAPTLNELFAGVSSTRGGFEDIHTGVNTNVINLSQGNPNLKPEIARTLTLGGIWRPSFLPGFSASVDFYRIKINDQIDQLGSGEVNQRCESSGGTDPLCDFIIRPFPFENRTDANFPISISRVPFNQASAVTYGFDYELNYRMDLDGVFSSEPSTLDLRLIGNHVPSFVTQTSAGAEKVQLAGVAGGGVARDRINASAQFSEGPFSFGMNVRFIGVMYYDKDPATFITNNRLAPVAYLGANISYDLDVGQNTVTLFANANNITDHFGFAPGTNSQPTEFYPTFTNFYDVVGAYFVGGVRFQF